MLAGDFDRRKLIGNFDGRCERQQIDAVLERMDADKTLAWPAGATRFKMKALAAIGIFDIIEFEKDLEIQRLGQFLQKVQIGLSFLHTLGNSFVLVGEEFLGRDDRHRDRIQWKLSVVQHRFDNTAFTLFGKLNTLVLFVLQRAQVIFARDSELCSLICKNKFHIGDGSCDHGDPYHLRILAMAITHFDPQSTAKAKQIEVVVFVARLEWSSVAASAFARENRSCVAETLVVFAIDWQGIKPVIQRNAVLRRTTTDSCDFDPQDILLDHSERRTNFGTGTQGNRQLDDPDAGHQKFG